MNYAGTLLASGYISPSKDEAYQSLNDYENQVEQVTLTSKDFYKMLYLRGYSYK